jgi:hypothetical protein
MVPFIPLFPFFWGVLTIKAFFNAQRFDIKKFGEKTNILNFSM